jgi:hypothetical protein
MKYFDRLKRAVPKTLEQSRRISYIINLSIMQVQELSLQEMNETNGGLLCCLGGLLKGCGSLIKIDVDVDVDVDVDIKI